MRNCEVKDGVRADQREWVIDLIGRDRAMQCNSIPRAYALRETEP